MYTAADITFTSHYSNGSISLAASAAYLYSSLFEMGKSGKAGKARWAKREVREDVGAHQGADTLAAFEAAIV